MKKILSKSNYKFLLAELKYQKDKDVITEEKLDNMMSFYEEGSRINFIKVIITIGAILIGLGILSFVASNWVYMSKVLKVIIIIATLGISIFTSFKTEESYPNISRALLYLSALVYGAGIFLIGQIFNYGGEFASAFFIWSIGVLSIALILKEKVLFIFANVLLMVYIRGSFEENIIIFSISIITIFYIGNKYFNYSKLITFFNNAVALSFILYLLNYIDLKAIYGIISFLLIGLAMYYIKHKLNLDIFKLQGIIIFSISGVFSTFKYFWEQLSFIKYPNIIAVIFGIGILIYLITLVRKGLVIPVIFICIFILRYYFDTLYDFMPKSLFFIIGGIILLGFGYYFERLRKIQGGVLNEENN